MARQVQFPTKIIRGEPSKRGDQSKFQLGGALAGLAAGIGIAATGGAGAPILAPIAAGTGLGSTLGSLSGMKFGKKPTAGTPDVVTQQQGVQAPQQGQAQAMSNRLEQQRQNRLAILRQAEASLPQLPPDIRAEVAPTIIKATMMQEKIERGGRLY